MHAQMKADPGCTNMPRPEVASPREIEVVLNRLACYIKTDTEADMLGLWATSSLASKLGITAALAASPDPVEVVQELGDGWANEISTALAEHPDQMAQVLRAAMAVIQKIAAEVRSRGLAG